MRLSRSLSVIPTLTSPKSRLELDGSTSERKYTCQEPPDRAWSTPSLESRTSTSSPSSRIQKPPLPLPKDANQGLAGSGSARQRHRGLHLSPVQSIERARASSVLGRTPLAHPLNCLTFRRTMSA